MPNPTKKSTLEAMSMEFEQLLNGLKGDLGDQAQSIAEYAAQRADHLSTIVHEPGYEQAVEAEAHNVALKAGLAAVAVADSADAKAGAMIGVALRYGARFLSLLAV